LSFLFQLCDLLGSFDRRQPLSNHAAARISFRASSIFSAPFCCMIVRAVSAMPSACKFAIRSACRPRGIEHKDQRRSRPRDVCGCDGRDQSAAAGERSHAKRIVPTHHGVMAEVVAVDSQQELAGSCCGAAGRERSDGRRRWTSSAGHGYCQRDREHDENGQSCSRGHWVCTSGTLGDGTRDAQRQRQCERVSGGSGASQLVRQMARLYA